MDYILVIDVGTSSLKAMLYDSTGNMLNRASQEYHSEFFSDNHVEQDPLTWKSALLSTLKKSSQFIHFTARIGDPRR
jgi:xylulokinase/glycerol kinase